ncbi:MAG TPA: HEAT repeat domain-containing protein, partial [Prosthecobacter sp.]|nr:HEAT repeat domain-containing protein [Prosthecobacter sp.]
MPRKQITYGVPCLVFDLPLLTLLSAAILCAQEPYKKPVSVGEPPEDHSPAAELATFQVLEGFEVNLFADESDGIANALVIRWDEKGRLWCLQTSAYPQPAPDEPADDKVIILEDTDGDGRADKSTVWASGLRMPMGMELAGPGQLYVGEGEKLLLLTDTDGDDRADRREVIFSGFGTGDTHQNLNSFVWAPEGCLVMHQGLHCYSRVVTPHGVAQLYGAGFWRYWPRSQRLEAYPTGMPLNPWGTAFTREGQPIMVAGAAGMFWARPMEIAVPEVPPEQAGGTGTTAGLPYFLLTRHMLPHSGQIIKTSGLRKFCGVDIAGGPAWPGGMHGEVVTGGFFENAVYRHQLIEDKDAPSGFEAVEQTPLITSSSVAFRPVDVRFGPDGALYIADWYNPIIGHYQASFRHPNRDKQHGRIWRVAAKGRELSRPNLATMAWVRESSKFDQQKTALLLSQTEIKGDLWLAYQAERILRFLPDNHAIRAASWELGIDDSMEIVIPPDAPEQLRRELEEVIGNHKAWVHQQHHRILRAMVSFSESVHLEYLQTCLGDGRSTIRAWATHSIGDCAHQLPDVLALLEPRIADPHPRVRLEAIVACAKLKSADALRLALKALDAPMDTFLDRALWLAVHATAPQWKQPGTLAPFLAALPPEHLSYVLEKDGSRELIETAREMLASGADTLPGPTRLALHRILIRKGGVEDQMRALQAGMEDIAVLTELKLTLGAQAKAPAPEGALPLLLELLASDSEDRRAAACELAAVWRLMP